MIKNIYNFFTIFLKFTQIKIEILKTYICEKIAIYKKKHIWKQIKWSFEDECLFNKYWVNILGYKISNKYAKLYQAQSGEFHKEYFPEILYSCKLEPRLNDYYYSDILSDKGLLEYLCSGVGVVFPQTITLCSGGYFFDNKRNVISQFNSNELIKSFLNNNVKCIIKPTRDSSSGKGIIFIYKNDNTFNEKIKKIYNETNGNYIAQNLIEQHIILNDLNPSSINTIRIITYIANDEIHHSPLSLRIGRKNSNVDNIHAGGLVIGIKENGQLRKYAYELGYGDKIKKYEKHPDSRIVFSNIYIPYISEIISKAKLLHGRFLHIGIISWDFTIGKNNEIILIEANLKGQSIWFPQIVNQCGLFENNTKAIIQQAYKNSFY